MGENFNEYKLADLYPKKPKPGARYYIQFSAVDTVTGELVEKRFYIPAHLKTQKEKTDWAKEEIAKINAVLVQGATIGEKDSLKRTRVL